MGGGKPEGNGEKPNKPEKPEKPNKPGNGNKPNKPNKPGNGNKPNKPNKPGNGNKPNKPNKPEKPEKPEKEPVTCDLATNFPCLMMGGQCVDGDDGPTCEKGDMMPEMPACDPECA